MNLGKDKCEECEGSGYAYYGTLKDGIFENVTSAAALEKERRRMIVKVKKNKITISCLPKGLGLKIIRTSEKTYTVSVFAPAKVGELDKRCFGGLNDK